MLRLGFAALALCISLAPAAFGANLDAGFDAMQREDWPRALREFRPAAEAGEAEAQTAMGILYQQGSGVKQDYAEAARWYRMAADQGQGDAQVFLAFLYQDGRGVPKDMGLAARWYRAAADQGDATAQLELGLLYQNGDGVPRDLVAAAQWLERSAVQDDPVAQYYTGLNYYFGRGVDQDFDQAVGWFISAADQGHDGAEYQLGQCYEFGDGVPQDYAEAAFWYELAAEQGHARAQLALGYLYADGVGVAQDDAKAAAYYQMAADGGLADAQYELGRAYDTGTGVPEDVALAFRWYLRAAEQGHADAEYQVAVMFDEGYGTPEDDSKAANWYLKAARQGVRGAANNLGVMFEFGEGVPLDLVQAYFWYQVANIDRDYDLAERNAKDLEPQLGTADLTRARGLVAGFAAGTYEPRIAAAAAVPRTAAPAPQAAAARDDLKRMQASLAALGYDPGPADGVAGERTKTAIRTFQQDFGLPVTGTIDDDLRLALNVARAAEARRTKAVGAGQGPGALYGTGTGFVVSTTGQIVTNNHVIQGCAAVRVRSAAQQTVDARVMAAEADVDLALLSAPDLRVTQVASFRTGRGVRPGDDVVVLGFPLFGAGIVAEADAIVTTGTVSALAGPRDDRRILQMTAPVQPGNSGGPLLDAAGNIIGVVVAKLDALVVADAIGDIPQNVNFAIHASSAQVFLDAHGVDYRTADSGTRMAGAAAVAANARGFTVLVECFK